MSLVINVIDLVTKHKSGELRCPATALIYMGKRENYGVFENYCSLRPEKWQMQTTNGVDEGM